MTELKLIDPRKVERLAAPLRFQLSQDDGAKHLIKVMGNRLRGRGFKVSNDAVAECLLEVVERYQLITKWRLQQKQHTAAA